MPKFKVKAPFVGGHLAGPEIRSYLFARVGRNYLAVAVMYDGEYLWRQVAQITLNVLKPLRWLVPYPGLSAGWVEKELADNG